MSFDHLINKKRLVVGLGMTGLSCARFLSNQGCSFDLCDTRPDLSNVEEIKSSYPDADIILGPLDKDMLCRYEELVVSPGVALSDPALQYAKEQGVSVVGDVQIFSQLVTQPIVAITGSNGKSTVTTLVGNILESLGLVAGVGGNIGVPVLDLLDDQPADVYVLELSSFQLETTTDLSASVATILNVSPDHMDRYNDVNDYIKSKQRVFQKCQLAVVNRDDINSLPLNSCSCISFGNHKPEYDQFGISEYQEKEWISYGEKHLIETDCLKIKGLHNCSNVMAALAIVQGLAETASVLPDFDFNSTRDAIYGFEGLAHRCQWVGCIGGVDFYNDSKGTNVGSTIAAIRGLAYRTKRKIWVLMGGVAKDQSFTDVGSELKENNAFPVLYGQDKNIIAEDIDCSETCLFHTMDNAFSHILSLVSSGDIVLLSPACASFDQFGDYQQRGIHFVRLVNSYAGRSAS